MSLALAFAASTLACGGGSSGSGRPAASTVELGRPGPGDAQAYLPLQVGARWMFLTRDSEASDAFVGVVRVAGTRVVGGATAMVVTESPAGGGTGIEELYVPDANGLAYLGTGAPDVIETALGPYWQLRYPVQVGTSFVQLDRKGVPVGEDLDGDGRQESLDVESVVKVAALESVTVPAGTFAGCARVELWTNMDVVGSRDGRRIHTTGVATYWLAPGTGWVKRTWTLSSDAGLERTRTEELIAYAVGARSGSVTLRASPASLTTLIGNAQPVNVVAVSQDGSSVPIPATWTSSSPSVAGVRASGPFVSAPSAFVTGVAAGDAIVSASIEELVSNPIAVTVRALSSDPVQQWRIYLNTSTLTLATGASATIPVTVYDERGYPVTWPQLSWTSSDPAVATVDSSGAVTGVGAGTCSITAMGGGATSSPVTVTVTNLRAVALRANDLVADPARGVLYASVPSSAGVHGNSIAEIDPATRTVAAYHFVGSEPGKLALSDDARFLYVALDGAGKVARLDLTDPAGPTVDLQFSLGSAEFYGVRTAEDIAVMPGAPGTVAISLKYQNVSPRHAGVAIYDDGVQRPTTTPGHTGANVIEFGASGARLYGLNNETTEFGFRRMQVDASGVSVLTVDAFSSGFGTDFTFASGVVLASSGAVWDPEARSLLGRFTGMTSPVVERSPTGDRVLFVAAGDLYSGPYALRAYDRRTFVPVGSVALPGVSGTPAGLVRWGTRGVAFRSAGSYGVPGENVYFLETDLAAP